MIGSVLRRACIVATVAFISANAWGQKVTYENSVSSALPRAAAAAAIRQRLNDFPDFDGNERGTLIGVNSTFLTLDITITCEKDFGEGRLLKSAVLLSQFMGYPNADFIVRRGKRLNQVDINLRKYMHRTQWESSAQLQLDRIDFITGLTKMPQPIGLLVRSPKHGDLLFDGKPVRADWAIPLETSTASSKAARLSYLRKAVSYRFERHWYGLASLIFSGIFLSVITIVGPLLMWRSLRKLRSKKMEVPPLLNSPAINAPAPSLAANQQRYQANRFATFFRYIPFGVLGLGFFARAGLNELDAWIPPEVLRTWLLPLLLFGGLLLISARVASAIFRRKMGEMGLPQTPKSNLWFLWPSVAAIVIVFGFTFLRPYLPEAMQPRPAVRGTIDLCIVAAGIIGTIWLFTKRISSRRIRLQAGDPDFDAATYFAQQANVKLRRVEISPAFNGVNAAATLGGRVLVSPAFREKVPLDERRAVIAHEIGHLKGNHVPILMLVNLGITFGLVALFTGLDYQSAAWPSWARDLFHMPGRYLLIQTILISVFVSPLKRKAEHFADTFALKQTQDYRLVSTALARIHLLNGAPHTLRPGEERMASHPSLTKRLASLRAAAIELGLPVDDSGVNELMHGRPADAPPILSTSGSQADRTSSPS